jgi:hypothetical protein
MVECPDCYSKVGSLAKHRRICLVRNNHGLATWLESIEFWLDRMERHLNQAYKSITRYTHVGKRDFDHQQATAEFESAAGMVDRVPKLLERIQPYQCERVSAAQLRASIIGKQVSEVRTILRNLS